jgi:predicted metal-binding membrane protein
LETFLKRDRAVVISALAALVLLAWAYLFWLANRMNIAGSISEMPGMIIAQPSLRPWNVPEFAFTFAMWAVMMVGMMLPSAAPMILLYSRIVTHAHERGWAFAKTGWFLCGYLLSWTLFSLAATVTQGMLEHVAVLTPMMVAATHPIAGIILIGAGFYQWTPLKHACLTQCRSPLEFIQLRGGFGAGGSGALRAGFIHGLYCVGCCWALMTLLFAGGVMNIVWIAVLAVLVFLEKVFPGGYVIARIAGVGLVAIGLGLVLHG